MELQVWKNPEQNSTQQIRFLTRSLSCSEKVHILPKTEAVFVIYDSKTIGVVLNIISGKNLSFMLPKKTLIYLFLAS
jgi:hypothetical protein